MKTFTAITLASFLLALALPQGSVRFDLPSASAAGLAASPAEADPAGPFNGDFNGEPPSDLIVIAPGLLAIVDHVAGFVVFVSDQGAEIGRKRLPGQFRVGEVRSFPDRSVLVATDGRRKIVLPRLMQPPAILPDVAASPIAANDPDTARPKVIRRTARRLGLIPPPGTGFAKELEIRGITPGYLASATFLGVDSAGRAYTLAREMEVLETETEKEGPRYVVNVTLTIGRHGVDGTRTEVAGIPLNRLFKTPRGRYVVVEPAGSVVALLPLKASGDKPQDIYLYRPAFVAETRQKKVAKPLAAAASTKKALAVSLLAADTAAIPKDEAADTPLDLKDAPVEGEPVNVKGRRTIAKMKQAAAEILGFKWTVRKENLALPKQADCDFKAHDSAHAYELPHQLKQAKEGDQITGVPYNWDGKGDLNRIRAELNQGLRAGNICSQIEEKSPNTTGLDCSGFIALVWGVESFGTSNAYKISDPLRGLNALRWGDVFNKPGSHIRLYAQQDVSDEHGLRIRTHESTTACSGTCDVAYHVEHFHGFDIRRLKATP